MVQTCPDCGATYNYDVRYCEDCGASIDEDATLDDRGSVPDRSFLDRHWAKILVLTAILLVPTLPGLAASGNLAGAFGFLMGAGVAGLALSAAVVFVGDFVYGAVAG